MQSYGDTIIGNTDMGAVFIFSVEPDLDGLRRPEEAASIHQFFGLVKAVVLI